MHERPDATTAAVTAILELVASERDDYILWLLDTLKSSPVRFVILNLHSEWQADNPKAFAAVVIKAVHDLDRLEKRRSWRNPGQVVEDPHIPALNSFARARRARVPGIARGRRLDIIGRKLQFIYDRERHRRQLEEFIRGPGRPVDPEWLREFLKPLKAKESEP